MEFTEFITSLGLDATQIADEAALISHLSAQLGEVVTLQALVTKRDANIVTLTGTITERDATIVNLTSERDVALTFKAAAEAAHLETRTEAKKFYNLLKGDKVDAAIIASLDNGDISTVTAQLKDYQEQYEAQVPLTCQDCHSVNVSRASSQVSGSDPSSKKDYREIARNREILERTEKFVKI